MTTVNFRLLVCLVICTAAPVARAQWAVVDAPAIAQLIQEVQTMQQQLATTRDQLQSSQQALAAMTGDRGMALLQGGISRNYLPATWNQVTGALRGQGGGGYGGLSADVRAAEAAAAVLTPRQLAALSPVDREQIMSTRRWGAMQQALSRAALANASTRFASIQNLITAISSAADQKAILDLQARISAELGMLQNEQTKVQVLYQATEAEEASLQVQAREHVLAEHGRFDTRFQPIP